MSMSEGEASYSSSFVFKDAIDKKSQEELRDYLYKFAFNLQEAHEYMSILDSCADIESKNRTEFIQRIFIMSLLSISLSIRKITDRSSERSIRKLERILPSSGAISEYSDKIEPIYANYEKFLNKFVAHQDKIGIHDALGHIPDLKIMHKDLQTLREYYLLLCNEICRGYIGIDEDGTYFGFEINKLLN